MNVVCQGHISIRLKRDLHLWENDSTMGDLYNPYAQHSFEVLVTPDGTHDTFRLAGKMTPVVDEKSGNVVIFRHDGGGLGPCGPPVDLVLLNHLTGKQAEHEAILVKRIADLEAENDDLLRKLKKYAPGTYTIPGEMEVKVSGPSNMSLTREGIGSWLPETEDLPTPDVITEPRDESH